VIVADSSALVKYILREEDWHKVREYLRGGCAILDHALKEIANALWKRVIANEISESFAHEILDFLLKERPFKIVSQEELLQEALSMAVKEKLTVYDTLFISLAKKNKLPLLTSDTKQAKAAKEEGVEVILV